MKRCMLPSFLALTVGTAACLSSALHAGDTVSIKIDGWYAAVIDGSIDATGGEVDYGDLKLDDGEFTGSIQGSLNAPLPMIPSLHAGYLNFEADKADSDLAVSSLYGELAWGMGIGIAGGQVGLAVHSIGGDVTAEGDVAFDDDIIIPALSVRGYIEPIDLLSIDARIHWGQFDGDTITDAEVSVTWNAMMFLGVRAGYRYVGIELDEGDDLDLVLGGPFLGAELSF